MEGRGSKSVWFMDVAWFSVAEEVVRNGVEEEVVVEAEEEDDEDKDEDEDEDEDEEE